MREPWWLWPALAGSGIVTALWRVNESYYRPRPIGRSTVSNEG